jgi:phage baseplate assembly protein W
MEGNALPTCSLAQSISQNLELIIMSRFGEHRNDPSFGCEIWDVDFELIVSATLWEEKLRPSLLSSVHVHEKRLSDVQVNITIADIEKFNLFQRVTEIKKRVDIHVSGIIRQTGEAFGFRTNLFLSPLTRD